MKDEINVVQESVKLALDAAEAAADITAELNKVKEENKRLIDGVSAVYKHSRTIAIIAGVAVFSVLALSLIMHFRSVSSLEILSRTSREALVVFAENVDGMKKSAVNLEGALQRQSDIIQGMQKLSEEVMELRVASAKPYEALNQSMSASFAEIRAENSKLNEFVVEHLKSMGSRIEKSQSESAGQIIKSTNSLLQVNQKGSDNAANLGKAIDNISNMQKRVLEHLKLLVEENSRLMKALEENARQIKYP